MNDLVYKVKDKEYIVNITYKRIRNIHYRFRDGHFEVSCSRLVSKKSIIQGLDKFAETLIEKSSKPSPIGDDYIYLFGDKHVINESGKISFGEYGEITYKSKDELIKKLKLMFLKVIEPRVRYYETKMNLPSYRITVRNMTTRYGSNSKRSKHITFATTLLHYSIPIIDSVIVHELAHIKEFNHSKKFYDVVYKYYPDYDYYHKKLRRGEFK